MMAMISSEAESSYLLDLSGVDTGLQPNPTATVSVLALVHARLVGVLARSMKGGALQAGASVSPLNAAGRKR